MKRAALLLAALSLLGCAHHRPASEPLPAVQWNDVADALRIVRERLDAV
jgi:hypothetical protein